MESSHAANILAFSLVPAYSHQMPVLQLTKALAARGHNVTVVTAFPSQVPIQNYTKIDVSFTRKLFSEGQLGFNLTTKIDAFEIIRSAMLGMSILAEAQLKSPAMRNFMSWAKDVKFDVVLYENIFMSSFLALAHSLGSPPVIAVSTLETNTVPFSATMGSPVNLAYSPICLPFTDHMTFYEKLTNVAVFLWYTYYRDWRVFPEQDRIVKEVLGEGFPSAAEMERNVSLLMHLTFSTVGYPQAVTPNIVHVGATHIQKPKPLPKDLDNWVSGADDGVIYFSLGSNMQGTSLPVELREAFLSTFLKLPNYRVIWKWESDTLLPGQPKNVLFKKWTPQQDLLAHPKVKLFITQGGLQSLQESIHYAVPVVGIPLFADQFPNIRKIVDIEAGVSLDFEYMTNDTIFTAVNEVLHNPKYRKNMRRLSDISKDTVLSPTDQAIWWVEYVIRHNGARHLRPATLDLHWTQYYLIDVAAFVITVISVIVFVAYKLVQFTYRQYLLYTVNQVKLKKS